jgi:hypothetical protein
VRQDGLVEISLGADSGLRKGHKLEVFRGPTYVGRVEVLETTPDRAVCKSDPAFQKSNLQKGDRIKSKLD